MMNCPILNAETRLADAANYWKQAHDAYFDPDEFRRNVQSSIQAFRSVTWLLQNKKASISSNFEEWYNTKQDAMRKDKRLRWLITARNTIEKQGDLDTKSKFIIEYINSWLPSQQRVLSISPNTHPKDMIQIIAGAYPESKCKEGAVLKVSREWIDSAFPEEEILSLLIHAYTELLDILLESHQLLDEKVRNKCDFYMTKTCSAVRLPTEMLEFQFPAVCWYSLEDGVLKEYDHKTECLVLDQIVETVVERYGNTKKVSITSSFTETCDTFFAVGKKMMQKDGYHTMIAMIITENGFRPFEFRPADRADKHIMIRELASSCKQLRAISCILIGETWLACFTPEHGPHAANYPNRREALSLAGFHKDEGYQSRIAIVERNGNTFVFSDVNTLQGNNEILRPIAVAIKQAWDL